MFANAKARLTALVRSLTRTGEEQPLHKVALAVVLLLDLFILVSIFDGLEVHTRQLASPWERVPQLCRELVIDRAWTDDVRLERLASTAAQRRSPYRDPDLPQVDPVPACASVLSRVDAVAADEALGGLLEARQRLTAELAEADAALAREKGA
jgi:hypothetical protein